MITLPNESVIWYIRRWKVLWRKIQWGRGIRYSVQFSWSVVSDSVRPQRWQPIRLPRPWDSPGKNTGVGCHFLLHQASLSITNSRSSLKLMSTESVMPSNHLILCHPLLLLPSIFPRIRIFLNESALSIRWPDYWSFSFSISPSNAYSGLISFRMDWFDLLVVQGTLKSFLTPQFKCINSSAFSLLNSDLLQIFSQCMFGNINFNQFLT